MPYEIKYDTNSACVMCKMTGKIDLQIVNDFILEVIPFLEKKRSECVLNDLRGANLNLSTSDIYTIPKLLAQAGLGFTVRRAVVFNTKPDDFAFFETVSVNQAQQVRVFINFNEAIQWLMPESISV